MSRWRERETRLGRPLGATGSSPLNGTFGGDTRELIGRAGRAGAGPRGGGGLPRPRAPLSVRLSPSARAPIQAPLGRFPPPPAPRTQGDARATRGLPPSDRVWETDSFAGDHRPPRRRSARVRGMDSGPGRGAGCGGEGGPCCFQGPWLLGTCIDGHSPPPAPRNPSRAGAPGDPAHLCVSITGLLRGNTGSLRGLGVSSPAPSLPSFA